MASWNRILTFAFLATLIVIPSALTGCGKSEYDRRLDESLTRLNNGGHLEGMEGGSIFDDPEEEKKAPPKRAVNRDDEDEEDEDLDAEKPANADDANKEDDAKDDEAGDEAGDEESPFGADDE